MTQANRTLVFMGLGGLITAALGAYAWFGVVKTDEAEHASRDRDERLFQPARANEKNPDGGAISTEFVRIRVTSPRQQTTVERTPGAPWRVVSPVAAAVDPVTIDAVLSTLQNSKFKRVIEEHPTPKMLSEFGLATPQLTFEAEALVGPQREPRQVKLTLGAENPYDGSIYLQRGDDPRVYAAEAGVRWALDKTTYDFRQKALAPFEVRAARAFEARSSTNSFRLEADAEGRWSLVAPRPEPADQTTVKGLVLGVGIERARGFLDESEATQARLGFDRAPIHGELTLDDGSRVVVDVVPGSPDGGVQPVARVKTDGGVIVAEVEPAYLANFDRNPNDLVDHTVLRVPREHVAKVVVHPSRGPDIVAVREALDGGEETWRVVAPQQGAARAYKLSAFIWTVTALKWNSRRPLPALLAPAGLTDAARSVSLFDAQGALLGKLVLGAPVPSKSGAVFARGTGDQLFEVDSSRLGEIPETARDWLELPDAGHTK